MKNRPTRKSTEQFIQEANEKHNNYYTYERCVYINAHTKVIVTCPKHGDYECKPNNHLNGSICKQCSIEKSYMTTDEFIDKIIGKHGNKFLFDKTIYSHSMKDVIVTCIEHGDFLITPNRILSGRGCQKCSRQKLNTDEFIAEAKKVHGDKYDYSKVTYLNSKTPVEIICYLHGVFLQCPADHIHSCTNCPSCSTGGYKRTETGNFYIQEIFDDNYNIISYKYGITNKNPSERLSQQSSYSCYNHNIIFEIRNMNGEYIFQLEKLIKSMIVGKYIQKEHMKDGYTETINPKDIDTLENLIIEYMTNELSSNNKK